MKEYIEREAAIFDLEIYEKQAIKDEYALAIAGCRSHIRNIPAADVAEVRHGRWKDSDFISGMLTCTSCGAQRNPKFKIGGGKWNYCPNCGAKMDGGADDAAD